MFVALFATALLIPVAPAPISPVSGAVIQRFVAPACLRCSGHRGVTIASTPGQSVRAVMPGTITFTGQVAGRNYVVELIAPGVKVTYGWLDSLGEMTEGDAVTQGQVLGEAGLRTYLGVRKGTQYVEPLRFLGLGWAQLRGPGGVVVGAAGSAR